MDTLPPGTLASEERVFIDKEVSSHRGRPGALLSVLEAVQQRHPQNYLPMETLRYIAREDGNQSLAHLWSGDVLCVVQSAAAR